MGTEATLDDPRRDLAAHQGFVRMLRQGILLALISVGAGQPAFAQASRFVGVWELNRAQSQLPPGEPPTQTLMINIERADSAHVQWTTSTVNGSAPAAVESFDLPSNGEFYPISEDTTASVTLGEQTLKASFKGPNGETDALTCTLAAGGRRMSCSGSVTADGQTTPYFDVFDRK